MIDQFEKDLKSAQDGTIKCGYIFDPKILKMTDEWFITNINRFGVWWGRQSDVFDVNGYGKLQSNLSARDAQVIKSGIGNLVDHGVVPSRTLKNSDGSFYFYNSDSGLGRDFSLDYYGVACGPGALRCVVAFSLGKLMSSKNNSIAKLTQRHTQQSTSRCTIM